MPVKTITRSLAGGEIAPELAGRLDLNKFQTGLARSLNFEIFPHGPAANRTGWAYVLETKYSLLNSILLPFIYNTEQAYELEFGDQYVRIHTQAGTVLNAAQSITSATNANPGVWTKVAHGYTNGMWVYVTAVGMSSLTGRFYKIANATADTFTLTDLAGVAIDTTLSGAFVSGTIASVFEVVSPYVEADLALLNITQSNDVLTIAHPSYATREFRRIASTNWTFTIIATTPVAVAPTAVTAVASGGAGKKYRYKVTTVAAEGQEESLASQPAISGTPTAITGITNANPGVVTSVAHGRAVGDPVWITGVITMTGVNNVEFLVDTVPSVDTVTLKALDGTVLNTTALGTYGGGGTLGYAELVGDLTTVGNTNTISWTKAVGATAATRYNVFKYRNGLWAYIGQAAVNTSFTDDNITADISQTPPEINAPLDGVNNYPRAVGYYQGRRWFAGSNAKPQNLNGTRSGTESNMSYSIPTRDNDSISVRLTSRQANTIRHIVPLRDLLLLTSGAEWSVNAGNGTTITPSNIDYVPQGYIGASTVMPVVTSDAVIYAQDRGGRLREMLYSWEKSGYKTNDISIMAPHLFDAYTIVQMAYVRAPHPTIFCARSDGYLLGLTYVPEHQVAAWHQHNTDGLFKSVISVPEGNEDVAYAIIQRTINGRQVKYIERKRSRQFTSLADAFFVDAGVTYSGAAATVISGLHHLEGKSVAILADGAVQPRQVVTNGQVTLIVAASKVHIGLPYTADLHTLPMSFEAAAFGQGRSKNVNAAHVRVVNTSGLRVGPLNGRLVDAKQRTDEPYGTPPSMITDEVKVDLMPLWGKGGQIHIQQPDPVPTTILSITLEAAIGGN